MIVRARLAPDITRTAAAARSGARGRCGVVGDRLVVHGLGDTDLVAAEGVAPHHAVCARSRVARRRDAGRHHAGPRSREGEASAVAGLTERAAVPADAHVIRGTPRAVRMCARRATFAAGGHLICWTAAVPGTAQQNQLRRAASCWTFGKGLVNRPSRIRSHRSTTEGQGIAPSRRSASAMPSTGRRFSALLSTFQNDSELRKKPPERPS